MQHPQTLNASSRDTKRVTASQDIWGGNQTLRLQVHKIVPTYGVLKFRNTLDDIRVPLKGSIRVPLRGSFKGSIGFRV